MVKLHIRVFCVFVCLGVRERNHIHMYAINWPAILCWLITCVVCTIMIWVNRQVQLGGSIDLFK